MENYSLIWLIVGLILLLLEFIIPGFVIFFFGIGALITSLFIYLFDMTSLSYQLLVFIVSSLICLFLLRRFASKIFKGDSDKEKKLNNEFEGKKAIVIREIKPNSLGGKVEFNGTVWEAESEFFIPESAEVEIIMNKNLKLLVKPVE
ncbi:MAG: hypothetical protein HGGPFJEG_01543 [Ignavibacteria bacterium]|nr:hypothetical protein [Ignavibacteria bacterium]